MSIVGFSSVINVQLNAKREVTKIVNVRSTDIVIDPARGGKFLSAYVQKQKGETMTDETTTQAALTENQLAVIELQGANEAIANLQSQQAQSNAILLAQCASLLETSLASSKLPAAAQKAVKKPFALRLADGFPFAATELQTAIQEKREELAEIGAGNIIQVWC